MANDLVKQNKLIDNLNKIAYTIDKAYMAKLDSEYAVIPFDVLHNNKDNSVSYKHNIRALKIDKWVFDRDENPGKCFKNVLNAFADGDHTLALVVKRTPTETQMYFVVKNEGEGRALTTKTNLNLLEDTITGNFQGTKAEKIINENKLEDIFSFEKNISSIALMTNTPSEYTEDYIGQGIDKLLNGVVPENEFESYTVVFLAESLSPESLMQILSGYEEMATAISPFEQQQFQIGKSTTSTKGESYSETIGEMTSLTNSESTSDSISKTHSVNIGLNGGINYGNTENRSLNLSKICDDIKDNWEKNKSKGWKTAVISVAGSGLITAVINSFSTNVGLSGGYGYSWGNTKTDTTGVSKTVGNNNSETTGTSTSLALGESENTTFSYKNYKISNMLEKLKLTMDRINKSKATGLWKFSTYIMSEKAKTTKNIANILKGITQGKNSYIEPAFIQEWTNLNPKKEIFSEIRKYLHFFTHPVFFTADQELNNAMAVTPTSFVATDELSNVIVFPKKSLQGLPVLQGTQFGREPHSLLDAKYDLLLGKGYHMHQTYQKQEISISSNDLLNHTFVTGSTGAGKSNAIYQLLEQTTKLGVHFLVIEPAKGEYKSFFGKRDDVKVFGTNPLLKDIQLLRINPFSFPIENTHILEHLDRLVEIFNVCWPMYAAMPAVLKDAIEQAYINAGWDLTKSENKYDNRIFPTFADVLKEIKNVMNNSEYSDENKGNYSGALQTRLKSLTNGINGQIFSNDSISDEELFDKNVIIDLSRVGSTETKALIMGLLILKLQEHRMASPEINSELKHITVIEEAHNLLKRTSTEQVSESSNLLGKSVEMLANAIAEMRTYGEAFVIADQSPGLLDMSVIRNTNTKIILRLPDYSDRELVGRAAGLNEEQIIELGRLEKGVAVIRQNDWLEPVLCKIDKFNESKYSNNNKSNNSFNLSNDSINESVSKALVEAIMTGKINNIEENVYELNELKELIIKSNLETAIKCEFINCLLIKDHNLSALTTLCYDFFHASKAVELAKKCGNIESWSQCLTSNLVPNVESYNNEQINRLLALIVIEIKNRDPFYNKLFCRFTEVYKERGSIL